MLTEIVDAKEECDLMTSDVPNNFIQTDMPKSNGDKSCVIVILQEC